MFTQMNWDTIVTVLFLCKVEYMAGNAGVIFVNINSRRQ